VRCSTRRPARVPRPRSRACCRALALRAAPRIRPPPRRAAGAAKPERRPEMTDADYLDMEKSTIVRSFRPSPLLPLIRSANRALSALAPALAARRASRLFTTPPRAKRPDAEIALLATARARPMYVGGRPIETGGWGAGPGVLLVPGSGRPGAPLRPPVR